MAALNNPLVVCEEGHIVDKVRKRDGKCFRCVMNQHRRNYVARHPPTYTEEVRATDRSYRKDVRYKLKNRLFSVLGGECECCGEKELMFLCVDHKKGGGSKHRAQVGKSYRMFYWILRQIDELGLERVKEDFRILCWNCNSAMGLFGSCPHQRNRNNNVRVD